MANINQDITSLISTGDGMFIIDQEGRLTGLMHLFRPLRKQPVWSGMLRIYLLGPVQVRRADGSIVEGQLWKRLKVRALLAHLALQERRPVEKEYDIHRLR